MKVLVIEDTVTSATLICHLLEKMGLEPVHARDGQEGIEAFKRLRPDLVLLDIIMPGMDGFEVARRIRQLENAGEWTPIIFLSARTSDDDLALGISVGGDDYLVKPVSEIVLKSKVRAMQRIAQMRYSLLVLTRKLDEANRELTRLSAADGLTGIANRRCYDETLLREWRRSVRERTPISLLVADVDHFKQYNDGYGHQLGDDCLRDVARVLEGCLRRPTDLVARYGGEEFAAILPQTDAAGARRVAEAMRAGVEAACLPHEFSSTGRIVTVSVGVATAVPDREDEDGYRQLLSLADRALYAAKRAGRNRVGIAGEGDADAPVAQGTAV
ncbi:MAG: diguanylate cyclase [Rhodocyclaceae bacterium]|nr:diguanylate cyclase [Rhodocyclaceae bacterium]MCL4758386.1 diguanylate cyclase [Rhodocyclaceae bacterium]